MLLFMVVVLASYAVTCDASRYSMAEPPEDDILNTTKTFKVYWNVPTMQCKSKKIPFENLYEKYGIIQNANDNFRGDHISILYDPGLFPALLDNQSGGKYDMRNGGVPQQGNLSKHLNTFINHLDQLVPDKEFNGVGIIDFELWRPVFRQNYVSQVRYKNLSYELVHKKHMEWSKAQVQAQAKADFESAAQLFMQATLSEVKQQRPRATWGYYGFPYCYNGRYEDCSDAVRNENDQTNWLWLESTALHPSIYSAKMPASKLAALVRGRMREAARVRNDNAPILPYFGFSYRDGSFFTEEDLQLVLRTLYQSEASGFIIWGASNEVNTVDKCTELRDYVENVLGPAIVKYVKPLGLKEQLHEEIDETKLVQDPELDWESPINPDAINDSSKLTTVSEMDNEEVHKDNAIFNNLPESGTNEEENNIDELSLIATDEDGADVLELAESQSSPLALEQVFVYISL